MASIKNINSMQKSLKSVEWDLSQIRDVDNFIKNAINTNTQFGISKFIPDMDEGITYKTQIICNDETIIRNMILAYRENLVEDVKKLIEQDNLELTKNESNLIILR